MTNKSWNEADHPRDEQGKFTYKNGGASSVKTNNDDIAQILYGGIQKSEEIKNKERAGLIKELKGKLTPSEILYASNEELRKIRDKIFDASKGETSYVKPNDGSFSKMGNSVTAFVRNYNNMKEANTIGADKYFHSKANCEAAQQGAEGAIIADVISNARELLDFPKNKYIKKMSNKEILKDYIEDQFANHYGRLRGLKNPNSDCRIMVERFRPKGLDSKY